MVALLLVLLELLIGWPRFFSEAPIQSNHLASHVNVKIPNKPYFLDIRAKYT